MSEFRWALKEAVGGGGGGSGGDDAGSAGSVDGGDGGGTATAGVDEELSKTIFASLDAAGPGKGALASNEFVTAVAMYTAAVKCNSQTELFSKWFQIFNTSASQSMNKSDMTTVLRVLGKIKVLGKQEVFDHLNKLFSSARASYAPPSPACGSHADATIAGARTSIPRTSWILTSESFCGIGGEPGDDSVTKEQFIDMMAGFAKRMKAVPGLRAVPGLA